MSEFEPEESGLNDCGKWNGKWDTVEGRRISDKMAKEDEYRLFRTRILRDIGNFILDSLGLVYLFCAGIFMLWELSVFGSSDKSAMQYLLNGIHNLLTVSPIHVKLFMGVSVIAGIIAFFVFLLIPLPEKEKK